MAHCSSNRTDLAHQHIKLVGARHRIGSVDCELALADHVHELEAGKHVVGGAERFEVEHRPGHPLDGAMVLFDDVVEVFDLAHQDRHVAAGVDRIDRRLVGAALVHRDLLWLAVSSPGLIEEALRRVHVTLCRQQDVDGLAIAMLVDGAVEVLPDALDLDVGLIHAPAAADWALVFTGHLLDRGQETNLPPIDRRMADRRAALFHHFFQVSVAQRICYVPANADQDHIDRKAHPFEVEHVDSAKVRVP